MSFIDDIKAKMSGLVNGLDVDKDGNIDFEDLKMAAQEHGLGDKVEQMRAEITNENGKVDPGKAKQALEDAAHKAGDGMDNLKDKLTGK